MAVNIDISTAVTAVPPPVAPIRVTLPGGLVVQGVPDKMGAQSLEMARAAVASLGPALAPLGPVFSIIDAMLAVMTFAQSVPKVVLNPSDVVEEITKLVKKIMKLASLVPQLSVPLMVVGIIDIVIQLLNGIVSELEAIAVQEQKIAVAEAMVVDVPALGPLTITMRAQVTARRATLGAALADAGPLVDIINVFCGIVGLPGIALDGDPTSGTAGEAAASLAAVVRTLTMVRSKIPV